eukprot:COSAG06_NODE_648_length_13415_cov_83.005783_6_plen_1290_part_01
MHASTELQDEKTIVLAAVCENGYALAYASEQQKNTKSIVQAAVRQNGMALQYASDVLQGDEDTVVFAVQQNGHALQWASDELRDTGSVVFSALKENPEAFEHASQRLRLDKNFAKKCKNLATYHEGLGVDDSTRKIDRCKLIIVGSGRAGKTCFLNKLRKNSVFDENEESTLGIRRTVLELKGWARHDRHHDSESTLPNVPTLVVEDFAGQRLYYLMHHIFIPEDFAVFTVVVSLEQHPHALLNAYTTLDSAQSGGITQLQNLHFWLNTIHAKAPTAPVFVIGTHCDKISSEELEKRAKIIEQSFTRKVFEEQLEVAIPTLCRHCDGAQMTCISNPELDEEDLLKIRHRLSTKATEVLNRERTMPKDNELPEQWAACFNLLVTKYRDQKFITKAEFESTAQECGVREVPDQDAMLWLFDTLGMLMYKDRDGAREDRDGAREDRDGAREDRDGAREDRDGARGLVVLDPTWLMDIMSSLMRTDTLKEKEKEAARVAAEEEAAEPISQKANHIRSLRKQGRLQRSNLKDVLPLLWGDKVSPDHFDEVLQYMVHFDLCCQEDDWYLFPALFPDGKALEVWGDVIEHTKLIRYTFCTRNTETKFLPRSLFFSAVARAFSEAETPEEPELLPEPEPEQSSTHMIATALHVDFAVFRSPLHCILQYRPDMHEIHVRIPVDQHLQKVEKRIDAIIEHVSGNYGVTHSQINGLSGTTKCSGCDKLGVECDCAGGWQTDATPEDKPEGDETRCRCFSRCCKHCSRIFRHHPCCFVVGYAIPLLLWLLTILPFMFKIGRGEESFQPISREVAIGVRFELFPNTTLGGPPCTLGGVPAVAELIEKGPIDSGVTCLPLPPQYDFNSTGPLGNRYQRIWVPVLYAIMHSAMLCVILTPLTQCYWFWTCLADYLPRAVPVDELATFHKAFSYMALGFLALGASLWLIILVPPCQGSNGDNTACKAFDTTVKDPIENVLALRMIIAPLWFTVLPLMQFAYIDERGWRKLDESEQGLQTKVAVKRWYRYWHALVVALPMSVIVALSLNISLVACATTAVVLSVIPGVLATIGRTGRDICSKSLIEYCTRWVLRWEWYWEHPVSVWLRFSAGMIGMSAGSLFFGKIGTLLGLLATVGSILLLKVLEDCLKLKCRDWIRSYWFELCYWSHCCVAWGTMSMAIVARTDVFWMNIFTWGLLLLDKLLRRQPTLRHKSLGCGPRHWIMNVHMEDPKTSLADEDEDDEIMTEVESLRHASRVIENQSGEVLGVRLIMTPTDQESWNRAGEKAGRWVLVQIPAVETQSFCAMW